MPGTLPVINKKAMDYAMMVGLALNCDIPPFNQFSRKSYFYPDLPKGYQISQYEYPLAVNGFIEITLEDGTTKKIRVRRAHMEEDTGKLTHLGDGSSLVDFNRAGVPLLEIVSEPDIFSAEEAEAYARKLRTLLRYLGVNHGDMSKGILRFEANVSVMHKDDTEFRTRTEIKNLNSIRSMMRAIDYEVARQIELYEKGDVVKQATLGWDENKGKIIIQRYKERADEYRYFPEPDLPIVMVSREWVAEIHATLPELPDAKKDRFMTALGLSDYDARVLTAEKSISDYYEAVLATGADAKAIANWILTSLFSILNKAGVDRESLSESNITPTYLGELVSMVTSGTINKGTAEKVLATVWETDESPKAIVAREGLAQVSDTGLLEKAIDAVLTANSTIVQEYLGGKDKVFGSLMGKCMAELKGQGNAQIVTQILKDKLEKLR